MVDTSDKPVSSRSATASARVRMQPATLKLIRDRSLSKGDALEVARLAGIMAAKQTPSLIPLCHPLPLSGVSVGVNVEEPDMVCFTATVKTIAQTGVEMEALTAAATAALALYDMAKGVDREMVIEQIRLEEKKGGRSGHYVRSD